MSDPPPSSCKTILITGATGKQGSAVISSLLRAPQNVTQELHLLALTRNTSSPSAQSIASQALNAQNTGSKRRVTLIKGDLDDSARIREIFKGAEVGIWAVFAVLAFPGLGANADGEEKQGIALADIALEFGVSHFVFSSVERGGEESDDKLMLDRAAKRRIEQHIKQLGSNGLHWTILRPTFFMENFEGTIGKLTAAVLRSGLQPTTRVQLIAVEDIGHIAATVLQSPEDYNEKVLVLAGDSLTAQAHDEAYKRGAGRRLPAAPAFVAKALLSLNSYTRELISSIENVHDYWNAAEGGHDNLLQVMKEVHPGIMTFEDWARKGSVQKPAKAGWNQVSMLALATGKS